MTVELLAREVYSVARAGELLRVPATTLDWWLEGRATGEHNYAPVLRPTPTGSKMVTWGEFVEAGYLREYRRTHSVPLGQLREFIDRLREETGVPYPLADYQPYVGAGRKLVLRIQEEIGLPPDFCMYATIGGQVVLLGNTESFLAKVEFSDGDEPWAVRVHPDGKKSPVVFDPQYSYGEPTVKGIRTEVLAELVEAGEVMEDVADEYGLQLTVLKAALSYEFSSAAAA